MNFSSDLFIPWRIETEWNHANKTLENLVEIHRPNLGRAIFHAGKISDGLNTLFPFLDKLCAETCRFCPNPCCVSAFVWIDFKDLLFMRLAKIPVPPTQLINHTKHHCGYLGEKGCLLPRMARPWACTWYLCPPQAARLRKQNFRDRQMFDNSVDMVKNGRKQMEIEFVKTIMPDYSCC